MQLAMAEKLKTRHGSGVIIATKHDTLVKYAGNYTKNLFPGRDTIKANSQGCRLLMRLNHAHLVRSSTSVALTSSHPIVFSCFFPIDSIP